MSEENRVDTADKKKKKPLKKVLREWAESFIVALVIVISIRFFFFEIYKIPTSSMEPTLIGKLKGGDRVIVNKLKYRFSEPKRWDVFVFHDPEGTGKNLIKRITGIPGDLLSIQNGDIYTGSSYLPEEKPRYVQDSVYIKTEDMTFDDDSWEFRFRPEGMRAEILRKGDDCKLLVASAGKGALAYTRKISNFYLRKGAGHVRCPHSFGGKFYHMPEASTLNSLLDCPDPACSRKVDLFELSPNDLLQEHSLGLYPPSPIRSGGSLVGDMKAECEITCAENTGYAGCIILEDDKQYIFILTHPGARQASRLIVKNYLDKTVLASERIPFRLANGFRGVCAFENCDNRLSLYIDGTRIFTKVFDWGPDPSKNLMNNSGLKLVFNGFKGTIDDFRLYRDIYYTNRYDSGSAGTYASDPDSPFQLGDSDFFAMGDNSTNSRDSRYFGPVDRNLIMGNAVIVMPWINNARCKLIK